MEKNKKSGLIIAGLLTQTHEEKLQLNDTEVPEGATEVGTLSEEMINLFTTKKIMTAEANAIIEHLNVRPKAADSEEKTKELKSIIRKRSIIDAIFWYEVGEVFQIPDGIRMGIGPEFKVWTKEHDDSCPVHGKCATEGPDAIIMIGRF